MNKNYKIITDKILAEFEKGEIPWRKPWSTIPCHAYNYKSKAPYRGCNWVMLNTIPYQIPAFMTFKQAKAAGVSVRKGSKGEIVFFWGSWRPTNKESGVKEDEEKRFLKHYTVFNVSQLEGAEKLKLPQPKRFAFSPIKAADYILERSAHQVPINTGGRACYHPREHEISMPERNTFKTPAAYYETLFHELTHSTKAKLGRKQAKVWGDKDYAYEELVAELGSAFLCAACGIDNQDVTNKAAYLQSWSKHLEEDASLFYRAASAAQKSTDYILEGIDLEPLKVDVEATPGKPAEKPGELIPAEEIPFNLASEEQPDPAPALESARRSAQVQQNQLNLF